MMGQMIVELGRQTLDLGQLGPRHAGEVMVLVVVADVHSEDVHRAVIRIRLRIRLEFIMLGDEMTSGRVQTHTQERTAKQIKERFCAPEIHHCEVER